MLNLDIFNSLTRKKERFVPIDDQHVKIYACGPTVYNYAHIGNARMAVVVDMLVRLLRELYPKVTYVSNITDIDDKIIAAALELDCSITTLTEKYHRIYNEDMTKLKVNLPDSQPLATNHIKHMLDLIDKLIEKGYAYSQEGHVLFDVTQAPSYGVLSGRSEEEQVAGSRVEVAPYKRNAHDFILWKPSSDDQPGWNSKWGRGRPGWHIECSAMAESELGLPFDIHGGGGDLIFPHHENEIVQSICAHDHPKDPDAFARYWFHNGFVMYSGEKMSKSIGNIQLVHDLNEKYQGEVLRLALLSSHYRSPLNWTPDLIEQSKSIMDKLYRVLYDLRDVSIDSQTPVPEQLMNVLCDDVNTPAAIAELNQIAGSDLAPEIKKAQLLAGGQLLGLFDENPARWLGYEIGDDVDVSLIENKIKERDVARQKRDFVLADKIRAELAQMNIEIEDKPEGTIWRKIC